MDPREPRRGQCSVTSLVVQDLFGGEIAKTKLGGAWHFYNLINEERVDLTACQFDGPITYEDRPSTRVEALSDTSPLQYEALRRRLAEP